MQSGFAFRKGKSCRLAGSSMEEAEAGGGDPGRGLEYPAEMKFIGKTAPPGDGIQSFVGGHQELFGPVDADRPQQD